jgi:hypothetical protein
MTMDEKLLRMISTLREAIVSEKSASRERALALAKLEECEMWLEKTPPK